MTEPHPSVPGVRERLTEIGRRVRVEAVMTRREELVTAGPDDTIGTARRLMGETYDQLPVLDGSRWTGAIERSDLAGKHDTHRLSDAVRPRESVATIPQTEPMQPLIERLVTHPYVCVVEPDAADDLVGLVHYSDLNKHAFRANAYLWISKLEIQLARVVRVVCPDHEAWVKLLDDNRQVAVLGRYELAKRRGIELNPVEGTDLSDLLKIVRRLPDVCEELGISKKQFETKTNPLIKIRHAVMHPVRSLVIEHDDVGKLAAHAQNLVEILEAAEKLLLDRRNLQTP
jgi:CBS domain-containing protein